jgi:hypothetical protein
MRAAEAHVMETVGYSDQEYKVILRPPRLFIVGFPGEEADMFFKELTRMLFKYLPPTNRFLLILCSAGVASRG